MILGKATIGLFACGLIPLCKVDCLTPSVCVDDASGKVPDGKGNWLPLCTWASMNPDKRCGQMAYYKGKTRIRELCRNTCSNCPPVLHAEPTMASPEGCIDDDASSGKFADGKGNLVSLCTWASINLGKRCRQMGYKEDENIPIMELCGCTCLHCPPDTSSNTTVVPTPIEQSSVPVAPSQPPTETPSTVPTKCKQSDTGKTMYSNGKLMSICDWAREFPEERCDAECPCGVDANKAIHELCPGTCGSCESMMPSASPSSTVTMHPSTAPSICDDGDECHMIGEDHKHELTKLCDYAGQRLSRCNDKFLDGLIKDYCRHTCYVCRDMTEIPVICKDNDEKCRAVPLGNELVHLCKGFVVADLTRCDELVENWVIPEEIPAGDPQHLRDICRKSCGVCTIPLTSSSQTTSPATTALTTSRTVCKNNDEKWWAVPVGDTFMLL